MTIFFLGSLVSALLGWLMGFLSLFLIMLILIQRGKGGGLTGALGGPGGQSAFGSKAGDTFTVITIVFASIWGFTCAFAMWELGAHAPKTAAKETNLKAGPGDKDNEANPIVIPSADSTFGGLGSNTTEGIGSSSQSVELTPAITGEPKSDPADPPADDSTSDTEPSEEPADDTEPAEDAAPAEDAKPAEDATDDPAADPAETDAADSDESTDN